MRNKVFEYRPRHSTSLKLVRLIEITRMLGERQLTGDFQDMAKAFNTVWIDVFPHTITLLNIINYRVN
jgi:hypothetical protein